MILRIKVIIIIAIIITIIIKCRGRYKNPTATNTVLLVTLYNGQKSLTNIKKSSMSDAVRVLYKTTYSSLNVMNRGRSCRLSSFLGTLLHLISQEYL